MTGPERGAQRSDDLDAAGRRPSAAPVSRSTPLGLVGISGLDKWESGLLPPTTSVITGDARDLPISSRSIDLVVTSPPYWQKRDYGHPDQIGLEATPKGYVSSIMSCLNEWRRVLRPTGSVFLNVGDTYYKRSLVGIPGRIEAAAVDDGWIVRNRIIWAKDAGMPDPVQNRLANRHEFILHLAPRTSYYYDLQGYSEAVGSNGTNPGDVWSFNPQRNMGSHLAPFPSELVSRSILLACPPQVCRTCHVPRRRVLQRTRLLNPSRPQARRAMELAEKANLSDAHIAAIQATGVSDAGKALLVQTGTGKNSKEVQALAAEAKTALGGYFREFTFALKVTIGWTDCGHRTPGRGSVLDPFAGTGTTLWTAEGMGRDAVGVDVMPIHPRASGK